MYSSQENNTFSSKNKVYAFSYLVRVYDYEYSDCK